MREARYTTSPAAFIWQAPARKGSTFSDMRLLAENVCVDRGGRRIVEGVDFKDTMTAFNGFLNSFFENSRFDSMAVFHAGEAQYLLRFHMLTP